MSELTKREIIDELPYGSFCALLRLARFSPCSAPLSKRPGQALVRRGLAEKTGTGFYRLAPKGVWVLQDRTDDNETYQEKI